MKNPVLENPSFRYFFLSRVATTLSNQMLMVIVGWQMYDITRGRVSAVNSIFIGASNQLGEFESGVTASWFGTVPSVVLGGVTTMLFVALWIKLFPSLARRERLTAL